MTSMPNCFSFSWITGGVRQVRKARESIAAYRLSRGRRSSSQALALRYTRSSAFDRRYSAGMALTIRSARATASTRSRLWCGLFLGRVLRWDGWDTDLDLPISGREDIEDELKGSEEPVEGTPGGHTGYGR